MGLIILWWQAFYRLLFVAALIAASSAMPLHDEVLPEDNQLISSLGDNLSALMDKLPKDLQQEIKNHPGETEEQFRFLVGKYQPSNVAASLVSEEQSDSVVKTAESGLMEGDVAALTQVEGFSMCFLYEAIFNARIQLLLEAETESRIRNGEPRMVAIVRVIMWYINIAVSPGGAKRNGGITNTPQVRWHDNVFPRGHGQGWLSYSNVCARDGCNC